MQRCLVPIRFIGSSKNSMFSWHGVSYRDNFSCLVVRLSPQKQVRKHGLCSLKNSPYFSFLSLSSLLMMLLSCALCQINSNNLPKFSWHLSVMELSGVQAAVFSAQLFDVCNISCTQPRNLYYKSLAVPNQERSN